MSDDPAADAARPLLLTPEMRAEPGDEALSLRRAERLAALQAILAKGMPGAAAGAMQKAVAAGSPETRPQPAGTQAPAAALDPRELRAMLQAIVREELAGRTGERITSHLRRLVREEVEQALIRRELHLPR